MDEKELLFTQLLRCSRLDLYLDRKRKLDRSVTSFISKALRRRSNGEPLEYILGTCEFMGFEFKINDDVLIPRPETEILAETVLKNASCPKDPGKKCSILEIGTGSGCIAVSLARILPQAHITATDISAAALRVAKENAKLHAVEKRINFIRCDLFPAGGKHKLIVTNPPYIPTEAIQKLQPEIQYEPGLALDGGSDGLGLIRRIIKQASSHLEKEGLLILEIGFDQYARVLKILEQSQDFKLKEAIKDYNNIIRVIVAQAT
jgi:release factor glutamine methyltransferase